MVVHVAEKGTDHLVKWYDRSVNSFFLFSLMIRGLLIELLTRI